MAGNKGRSGGNRWLGGDGSKNDGPPQKPGGMPEHWNAKWDELMAQLPQAELRRIDGHQLRALVSLLVHEVQLSELLASNVKDVVSRRLYLTTVQSIGRLSTLFGLSPRDRKALDIKPPKEDDDADEWSD